MPLMIETMSSVPVGSGMAVFIFFGDGFRLLFQRSHVFPDSSVVELM